MVLMARLSSIVIRLLAAPKARAAVISKNERVSVSFFIVASCLLKSRTRSPDLTSKPSRPPGLEEREPDQIGPSFVFGTAHWSRKVVLRFFAKAMSYQCLALHRAYYCDASILLSKRL